MAINGPTLIVINLTIELNRIKVSRLDEDTLLSITTMNAEDASVWKKQKLSPISDRTQALAWFLVIIMIRLTPAIRRSFFYLSSSCGVYWDNINVDKIINAFTYNIL